MTVRERSTDMVTLPAGTFTMGSDRFYPEEGPPHPVKVDAFRIDLRPVTVARFREFVTETGYVTVAERAPDPADYPGADPALLVPGSLVFRPTRGPVDTRDVRNWWHWVPGATWRARRARAARSRGASATRWPTSPTRMPRPTRSGPGRACRRRRSGSTPRAAGSTARPTPGARSSCRAAASWRTPGTACSRTRTGGRRVTGTSPVGSFPANAFGLYDVCGNVWEWTSDFHAAHPAATHACCAPHNPRVTSPATDEAIPRRVIKGGSHLCAPNYCLRYRPAARQGEAVDTSTSHIGFRCVVR